MDDAGLPLSGSWAPVREERLPATLDVDGYLAGILARDRVVLARAITLIESTRPDHQAMARDLVNRVMPHTGHAIRIGITGSPGVGKSALIERFGGMLIASQHHVAVLTVDPSSERSGGSLLGDKTRMTTLSANPNAFIRPSPSGLMLGGTARETRETMLLCEAAGYDIVLVETVGVGQSEVTVAEMTDFLLVLMLAGAGDELQGIKRGLLELADLIAITKADGENVTAAKVAAASYGFAMHVLAEPGQDTAPVITCSAVTGDGLDAIWKAISDQAGRQKRSGALQARRSEQSAKWMWSLVDQQLQDMLHQRQDIDTLATTVAAQVRSGTLSPMLASDRIIGALFAVSGHGAAVME